MKVVCDIEANGLDNPDKIWIVVCKQLPEEGSDIDTGEFHIFRNPSINSLEKERFHAFARRVTTWIGHNWLEYDYPVLHRLLDFNLDDPAQSSVDTLIISRMVDYSRPAGHSIDAYGKEFGFEKLSFHKFTDKELENDKSDLFQQLETYCRRDVDITHHVFDLHRRFIDDATQHSAIRLEHSFQLVVNSLHDNGFSFNVDRSQKLLDKVVDQLIQLDGKILNAFPSRTRFIREYTPKLTKHGTISRVSVPRGDGDLCAYTEGASFSVFKWEEFNPSSHKQLIGVLNEAGWRPINKTQTHIDTEREIKRLKYSRDRGSEFDLRLKVCEDKLQSLAISGWKIDETNLSTLPDKAPTPARLLAKRIMYESRRRTLTEWLSLVTQDSGRIHGRFYGIGAWTHRMAHQKPNVANIPNEFNTEDGSVKLLGKEMRSLWQAPRKRLLVGVDAEGIQLRIFAHYVNDPKLIEALVKGDKKLKTDPHSYNRGVLNGDGPEVCRTRQAAKRFLYALFLGAGVERLAHILGSSRSEAENALARLLTAYPGFAFLKQNVIPADARRGYFIGLDGRRVPIPGSTLGERKHLCMSGYLQNGESVIIKRAAIIAAPALDPLGAFLVNIVHDEYQVESPNDMRIALQVAKIFADAIVEAGEIYKLKCPMAGSYWNDDHHDYTIGTNWYQTH